MEMTERKTRKKLWLLPYNGVNGIFIYCKSCGVEFEETDQGYYKPVVYEHEKYDRKCKQCRDNY